MVQIVQRVEMFKSSMFKVQGRSGAHDENVEKNCAWVNFLRVGGNSVRVGRRDFGFVDCRGEEGIGDYVYRRGADFRRAKDIESARSGVQQEVWAQRQNSFLCRAGDERDGRASHHRTEERRQGIERSLSWLAIASVPTAQRKGVGKSQLLGHLSLDHAKRWKYFRAKVC